MITRLDSANNAKIKYAAKLHLSKKERYDSSSFILEGYRSVFTLLEIKSSKYEIKEVFVSQSFSQSDRFSLIHNKYPHVQFYEVAENVFNKISAVVNNQGILAVVGFTQSQFKPDRSGLYLLLDSISDPGNMGTLIRSAVAAGFDALLLYGNCVDPFNPKTIRSSMGVFSDIDIFSISDNVLEEMISTGYDIIVTRMAGAENVFDAKYTPGAILVIGNEAVGVSDFIQSRANRSIYIPMRSACESLNAGVAGSICMFHVANKLGRLSNNSRR